MKKISLNEHFEYSFLEVFQMFITSRAAMGVADITLRNYDYNMRNIAKYLCLSESNAFSVTPREIIDTFICGAIHHAGKVFFSNLVCGKRI